MFQWWETYYGFNFLVGPPPDCWLTPELVHYTTFPHWLFLNQTLKHTFIPWLSSLPKRQCFFPSFSIALHVLTLYVQVFSYCVFIIGCELLFTIVIVCSLWFNFLLLIRCLFLCLTPSAYFNVFKPFKIQNIHKIQEVGASIENFEKFTEFWDIPTKIPHSK